ncbi:MAG: AAA family ATPase, partial [Candidatus Paracaedibacteraceae bacterium]|nr:AAA family ATPase [Candidatus Paracaedibacteraceae bacterium]
MLLEFSFENHRSMKRKVTLSMVASNDIVLESELILIDKNRLSRLASIYGANGSGKSTILSAMSQFKLLVLNSINHQPGDKVTRNPHKLSLPDTPTSFNCQFIKSGIRYAYGVSFTENGIEDEYLYHFKKGRQAKIFERTGMEITFGENYRKSSELALTVLKENRLFLSCAANYSTIEEIEAVFLFIKEDIVVYGNLPNDWLSYTAKMLSSNPSIKNIFMDFLHATGSDVIDV